MKKKCWVFTTTQRQLSMPMVNFWGNTEKVISHMLRQVFGKNFISDPSISAPCFDTAFARIGVYICYDRHFPEGARALGLNGAEIVFNPSATVSGLSEYLWKIEQPAHACSQWTFCRSDKSRRT